MRVSEKSDENWRIYISHKLSCRERAGVAERKTGRGVEGWGKRSVLLIFVHELTEYGNLTGL